MTRPEPAPPPSGARLSPFQSDHQAWQVPDDVADLLPAQAQRLEALRQQFLATCRSWGYALVVPPLIGYLPSLLSGTGERLQMQTFRFVDVHSGHSLGVRADTTPQVVRIDAHLLQYSGITRLCYVGPVLHTRAEKPHSTREPLQFGAEMYGHADVHSECELMDLAVQCLQQAQLPTLQLDMAHVRVVQALLQDVALPEAVLRELHALLASKDRVGLAQLCAHYAVIDAACCRHLQSLCDLYGDVDVLERARAQLPASPMLDAALHELQLCATRLRLRHPQLRISIDLADLQGYGYYSGLRFAVYAQGAADSIARGGRYDAIGAVFGRQRPAVGFSLDLKALLPWQTRAECAAIAAPWPDADVGASDAAACHRAQSLDAAIAALRAQGRTVVALPQAAWQNCVAHGSALWPPGFVLTHKLVFKADAWSVETMDF